MDRRVLKMERDQIRWSKNYMGAGQEYMGARSCDNELVSTQLKSILGWGVLLLRSLL
jgi:hypothetical protein